MNNGGGFISFVIWIVLSFVFSALFGSIIAGVIVGGIATVGLGLLSTII